MEGDTLKDRLSLWEWPQGPEPPLPCPAPSPDGSLAKVRVNEKGKREYYLDPIPNLHPSDEQVEQAVKVLHTMQVVHDACLITEDGAVHRLPGVIEMEMIDE